MSGSVNAQMLTMTHADWSADIYRQNVWYPCYTVVGPQSTPEYSGYCNALRQVEENGNVYGDYHFSIAVTDVLDSPIRSLTWLR